MNVGFAMGKQVAALALGCALVGCDAAPTSEAPRSRYDAVAASRDTKVDLEAFCEPWRSGDEATPFAYPPLAGEPPRASSGARWINVWATWCKPCVEELPRITAWRDELGLPLEFIAVDGDPEVVAAFAEQHPAVRGTLHVASADQTPTWLASLGLPATSVLPIHVFVDAQNRVRCVRTAGLSVRDRDAVRALAEKLSVPG